MGMNFQTYGDEDLISYLRKFVCGKPIECNHIRHIDLYGNKKPCELFEDLLSSVDHVNYFFTQLKKKSVHGRNFNRTIAGGGSWKGRDTSKPILDKERSTIGFKKTFRFDEERTDNKRTVYWIMKEYYLNETIVKALRQRGEIRCEDSVLCSITRKVSLGTKYSQDVPIPSGIDNVVANHLDYAPSSSSAAAEVAPIYAEWPLYPAITALPPLDGPFESLTEEELAFCDEPDPGYPQAYENKKE
ncbi:hypothetical protein K7X08_001096 [Anisodus acutangulus]|uniref:NAC domain-containing protein n=1 Tax=Anisodus acutangulus TaxID=402998 RepID=A0A9Q1RN63_9SOLA|nr:hypothetical protein K7X08_001096 [Anisodus acutangulus]